MAKCNCKMLGNGRVAVQLVASRVLLICTELVTSLLLSPLFSYRSRETKEVSAVEPGSRLQLVPEEGKLKALTNKQTKQTPWPLVRERTIPTDRPPLVDEI
jgi:hypothetical protein